MGGGRGKLWSLLLPSHLQEPENGVLVEVSPGWIISFIVCFFPRCSPLIPDGRHAKPEVNCILNNCSVQGLPSREKTTLTMVMGCLLFQTIFSEVSPSPHTLG